VDAGAADAYCETLLRPQAPFLAGGEWASLVT
jgi:hypothetical protein